MNCNESSSLKITELALIVGLVTRISRLIFLGGCERKSKWKDPDVLIAFGTWNLYALILQSLFSYVHFFCHIP